MSRRRAALKPSTRKRGHGRREGQPEHEQQVAGPRLLAVGQRHPECRAGHAQAGDGEHPPGPTVPGPVPSPEARRELERPEKRVRRGPEDVDDERNGEAGEAWVRGQHLRATGELEQAQGAGHDRDRTQRHQRPRDRPARTGRSAGASWSAARRSCRRLPGTWVTDSSGRPRSRSLASRPCSAAWSADRAPDQGGAVGVGAHGHPVEPARPPLVQPPAEVDLVPVRTGAARVHVRKLGARTVSGRHTMW